MIKDWIDSYMEFSDNTEPPALFREWVAISVIAATLERRVFLRLGQLTFYPNFYIVLTGPSGVRKGTAMKPGCAMLKDISGINMAAEATTREALIRSLSRTTRNVTNPHTGEVEFHSALTIYSEELTVFLGYNNLQLISDLTDWYDCGKGAHGAWTYETKSQGIDEIIGIWVNLIGATTPDLIASALPRDTIGGGLSSRMIFVFEERKGKSIPFPMLSDKDILIQKELQAKLEDHMMVMGEFKLDENFKKVYEKWYEHQETYRPFDDVKFDGYFQRRPLHLLKLCMIMCISRGDLEDMVIRVRDFERALDLLERTEVKMPRTFSAVGRNENVDVTTKIMYDIGIQKKIALSELMRRYYFDVDKDKLKAIVETLQLMDYIKVQYTDTGETYIIYNEKKEDNNASI